VALSEVGLAWLLVAAWFVVWEVVAARLERGSNAGGWLRAPAQVYVAEALLLTLFGALWFASLGSGGWVIMFALLGLLMEWPGPLRAGHRNEIPPGKRARATGAGILRIVAAGAILWWRMH
jgi:hypothetical protein